MGPLTFFSINILQIFLEIDDNLKKKLTDELHGLEILEKKIQS